MVSFNDVNALELNKSLAQELKGVEQVKAPEWAGFVKTGTNRQRPPIQNDWWYARAAAVLITVARQGPIGVNKLRVKYGGRKRRGHKPAEFRKSSGSILRNCLQQLEKAELVQQKSVEGHKGRVLTGNGAKMLAKAAKTVNNE